MKKTYVVVEVYHEKPVPNLAALIAQRAYTIDGVRNSEAWIQGRVSQAEIADLERAGFTVAEIALGCQEIVR